MIVRLRNDLLFVAYRVIYVANKSKEADSHDNQIQPHRGRPQAPDHRHRQYHRGRGQVPGRPQLRLPGGLFYHDRNGTITFDDRADSEEIENLIERLASMGFEADAGAEQPSAHDGLTIQMPADSFTPEALNNLHSLIAAKGRLIRKALGVDLLPVQVEADTVSFPWFSGETTAEEVKAYTHLITALCDMARNQKRITAKDKDTDNDKYAFRCFLLRLGFIGAEYKEERKILLRNLTGSSAFKSGGKAV